MIAASFILGALNILVMGLSFRGRILAAAVGCLLIQIPWTVYDIATHQYGFLLITAGSIAVAVPVLLQARRQRLYTEGMSELDETPVLAPVDQLRADAAAIAAANPPSRVVATAFLGLLTFVGWVIGRLWFAGSKALVFCALAVQYGYRKGAKVPTQPKKRKNIGA